MIFEDRKHAGRCLAAALMRFKADRPVILALPRGGVPVGYEVAVALDAPLDVIVVRKLGAPGQPELGLGAIVDGDHPETVLNEDVVQALHVSGRFLQQEAARELKEIRSRQVRYRRERASLVVSGRLVIVVDDGIATGGSMRAALRGVRRAQPSRLVLAVPVAPPDTVELLRAEVDEVVCLSTPMWFGAVGNFYRDFRQTTDEEVIALLADAHRRTSSGPPSAERGAAS